MATALVLQLAREWPEAGTPEAEALDWEWIGDRVKAICVRCSPGDRVYAWQLALWHLDAKGLIAHEIMPHWRS